MRTVKNASESLYNNQKLQCYILEQSKITTWMLTRFNSITWKQQEMAWVTSKQLKIPRCYFRTVKYINMSVQNSQINKYYCKIVKHTYVTQQNKYTNESLQNSQNTNFIAEQPNIPMCHFRTVKQCVTLEQSNIPMCHFRTVKHTNVSLENSNWYQCSSTVFLLCIKINIILSVTYYIMQILFINIFIYMYYTMNDI